MSGVEDKLGNLSKNACKMDRKGKTLRENMNIWKTQDGGPTYVKLCSCLPGAGDSKEFPEAFLKEFRVPKRGSSINVMK